MDIARVIRIVVTMLSPTLIVAGALNVGRLRRTLRRLVADRRPSAALQPSHPPIEQLAADLRRLLQRHESLRRSPDIAVRARRLKALEGAIGDCGTEAATALGLPCAERSSHDDLAPQELRRLLQALVDAGLVLPPASGLLAAEGHS